MIKKLIIPVDHGNRNMKTTHFLFTTGLSSTDRKPVGREDFLLTDGKYYVLSDKRIPYQRDKTQDERFSILTKFAIAKELERTGQVTEEDVVQVSLPIGVPPKHYAELADRYREYFQGDGKVHEMVYNGRTYHTCIQDVAVYPQAYAAMMTEGGKIRQIPKAVGIDIGGFTSDFLLMRNGSPCLDYCDSMEKGVITMYNDIISSVNGDHDMLLEETDIDCILEGKTEYYPDMVVHTVEEMARNFVTDLLSSVRERGIDTKSTYTIFIGGGAILLRRFLESSNRLIKYQFIEDIFANAKGYSILYRSSLAGK